MKKTKKEHRTTNKETRPQDANQKTTQSCLQKKESRQHRHKTMLLHCLDCKQTTQETKSKNKNIKHKNKLPFINQLSFKKQNCKENNVFHRLKAKQETRQKTKQEYYQKQNQHRNRKAEIYTMKTKTKTTTEKEPAKNESNLDLKGGCQEKFVSKKQANIRKGKGKKKKNKRNQK